MCIQKEMICGPIEEMSVQVGPKSPTKEVGRDWLRNKHTFKDRGEGEGRQKYFSDQISEAMCILLSKQKLLKVDFYLWKQSGLRKYLQDLKGCNF